jgi:phosphate transport system substrate-binding protein
LAELGFVSPSADDSTLNLEHLLNGITGRTFSAGDVSFTIPPTVFGTVTVAGTPLGGDYITALTSALSAQYPSITPTTSLRGQPNGIEALCASLADTVVVHSEPATEDLAACAEAGITTETIALGSQPLVLVANGQSDYLQCLTTDDIIAAWGAAEAPATTWSQVNASFPEADMTLLAPPAGTLANDALLLIIGSTLPLRADAFSEADAAYRAAATANVEGGMTFMTWAEYQTVLESGQQNITLVSVDAGSGCVTPSAATIRDGSYPIAQPLSLLVNRASTARAEVQALLWFLASDANYSLIEDAGLVGLLFGDLPELRVRLQDLFTAAQAEAQAAAEAAAEASAEATAEATEQAGS